MRIEVDAYARPVQPRGDLLDMGRLAGAVIARNHDAAIVGETGQDGERGRPVENVIRVDVRHIGVGVRICRHLHVDIDAEHLAHVNLRVGHVGDVEFHLVHVFPYRGVSSRMRFLLALLFDFGS